MLGLAQMAMGKGSSMYRHYLFPPNTSAYPMQKLGTNCQGAIHLLAIDVSLQKARHWYFHCLAVQRLPLAIDGPSQHGKYCLNSE